LPISLFDPIEENRAKFLPQRFPIVRFKIERIDVLVFLRRILSILYGAIGTFTKPLRVSLYIRMVRCALKRDIHGDINSKLCCGVDERAKVFDRAQLRVNALVSAVLAADRPW